MSHIQSDRRRMTTAQPPSATAAEAVAATPEAAAGTPDVPVPAPEPVTPVPAPPALPGTRAELQVWIREHLALAMPDEAALNRRSTPSSRATSGSGRSRKHEAIQALSAGFADKMARVKTELSPRTRPSAASRTTSSGSSPTSPTRSHRDPKTKLMNFGRFTEQLESFLALEQRGRWCAVGLVDITGFKWYNDALGHAVGDRIIERVAALLREQVRSDDLLAQERLGPRTARRICTRGSAATSSAS